jgi:hypothetical protein
VRRSVIELLFDEAVRLRHGASESCWGITRGTCQKWQACVSGDELNSRQMFRMKNSELHGNKKILLEIEQTQAKSGCAEGNGAAFPEP